MKNISTMKERIIEAATQLIEQSRGNITDITTRGIAEKAGVGIGLINYHFQTKENLITICVQRMIKQVISSFAMEAKAYRGDKERLTDSATYVFDFLFNNAAISRISIIGDLLDETMETNSVKTQKGFMRALEDEVSSDDKNMVAFMLTASMQVAFLSSQIAPELLGYDFNLEMDRAAFIKRLVTFIFDGTTVEKVGE